MTCTYGGPMYLHAAFSLCQIEVHCVGRLSDDRRDAYLTGKLVIRLDCYLSERADASGTTC